MELQFQKVNENEWVAEFQATADFNLHLERVSSGSITVAQRGTESGEYDTAWAKGVYEGQRVIDYDFGALVYPKWIKVTSSSEVVSCSVNFSEGGGSGTGGGEASTMEYFEYDGDAKLLFAYAQYVKIDAPNMGAKIIMPYIPIAEEMISQFDGQIIAIGVNLEEKTFTNYGGSLTELTTKEQLLQNAFTQEQLDAIPRITKEEFYAV